MTYIDTHPHEPLYVVITHRPGIEGPWRDIEWPDQAVEVFVPGFYSIADSHAMQIGGAVHCARTGKRLSVWHRGEGGDKAQAIAWLNARRRERWEAEKHRPRS